MPCILSYRNHGHNQLFKWFNDEDSFKFKIKTTNKISIAEHEEWFGKSLKDQNTFIWIIENENKESLGQIRFKKSGSKYYDIDIFVIHRVRKTGVASKALKKAENIYDTKPLRAIVKKNNYSSYLFFIRNSYSIFSEDAECWTLIKY